MTKSLLTLSLILIAATAVFSQNPKTNPDSTDAAKTPKSKKGSVNKSNTEDDSFLKAGTTLEAQLQQTLDVKNSKVGDAVLLKVTKDIKQNGDVIIPKGSKLIGHITEVRQKTKQNSESKLGLIFDRLEGKNLEVPISATIVSITNIASSAPAGDVFSSDNSASSSSSGTVRGGKSGGGLLGGVTGTVGGVLDSTTNTVGSVANTAGQTVSGTTQTLGNAARGIRISQVLDVSAEGTTMLSTNNKNLRVEKGANFRLRVTDSIEN